MSRPCVCVLALAAVLLLLGIATVSKTKVLRGKEYQLSQFPSHFSQKEHVTMKETLKGAIQIPTVSFSPREFNVTALAEFGKYLYKVFPTLFKTSFFQHKVVGEYRHLFTAQGSDPSLQPHMLLAHTDIVPAPDQGWEVPPFSGLERDGFIYSQGTIDNKNSVTAILQALGLLLIRNYIPRRSFYIALGPIRRCSLFIPYQGLQKVLGANGAQKISALLQARGVRLAFIVDEGGCILDGFLPDIKKPFAVLGKTPVPNMCGSGPLTMTLPQLADESMNNLWLFRPFVSRSMEKKPITNALVRMTTAVTMFHAGIKVNVIPPVAQAKVNFRIHPTQTVQEVFVSSYYGLDIVISTWENGDKTPAPTSGLMGKTATSKSANEQSDFFLKEVLELAKNIVADDRIQFHVLDAFDPLPTSPSDVQALGYQLIQRILQSVFPEVNVVVPASERIVFGGPGVGKRTLERKLLRILALSTGIAALWSLKAFLKRVASPGQHEP